MSTQACMLGIIAGGGHYPREVIEECLRHKRPFCVIALKGQCDLETPSHHPHIWLELGAVGKCLAFFRDQGVQEIIFAGQVRRPSLLEIKPDLIGVKWLAQMGWRAQGDDCLLRALGAQFEREGFRMIGSHDIFEASFFMSEGLLTTVSPKTDDNQDIERGCAVLISLGDQDVGQAVVVQQGIVLGVEAIEGTAALIGRCGLLKRPGGGGVLVKIAKPQQDMRMDLPTVGPDTIDQLVSAGLCGMALEQGRVQILEKEKTIQKANAAGLFIVGITV